MDDAAGRWPCAAVPGIVDVGDHEGLDWYLALCLGGLQSVVKTEVEREIASCGCWRADVQVFQEDFQGADTLIEGVHPGHAGCGKLIVATDAPPAVMRSISCIQGLFALVAHATSLDIVLPAPTALDSNVSPHLATTSATVSSSLQPAPRAGPEIATTTTTITTTTTTVAAGAEESNSGDRDDPAALAISRIVSEITGSTRWPAALDVWKRFISLEGREREDAAATSNSSTSRQPRTNTGERGASSTEAAKTSGQRKTSTDTVGDCGKGKRDVETLKFRASVVRDGRHAFNSMDALPKLGGAVIGVNPRWTVNLKEYDVEVVTFVLEKGVVVGLSLTGDRTKCCSNGRLPKEDKGFIQAGKRISSLRPSTAHVMLTLAKPMLGEIVVDCMCGVGTIPFLGARSFPGVFFIGGEVAVDAVEHMKGNLRSLWRHLTPAKARGRDEVGVGVQTAVGSAACVWNAQALPLRDGTVDIMVVDMPFGFSCGTPRVNEKLYPTALNEMARVVRPSTGRVVLLVTQPYLLGLPEIQKARRKEKGLLRKRCREAGMPFTGKGSSGGMAIHRSGSQAAVKTEDRRHVGADPRETHDSIKASNEGLNVPPTGCADETTEETLRGVIWRVRARHAVNVGGLISCLLILDRTDEPPPPQPLDRRKRWVATDTHGT